jgi:DNA-directed RNA polymerase specialized sigma24 family protein
LSDDERSQLEAWRRRRTSAQALAQRSRIVLLAAEGLKNTEIAERLGVPVGTVKSRSHRAHRRLASLLAHVVAVNRSDSPAVEVDEVARARQASTHERPKGEER